MKALSLWQPWATLMAVGAKRNETRSRRWRHTGDVVVLAARKRFDVIWKFIDKLRAQRGKRHNDPDQRPGD